MANKHYQKGYKFEAAVVEHLKSLGWEAKRAYASKGAFGEDVTAWLPGTENVMYVQCKADGRKVAGKPRKMGMMKPGEWNRFLGSMPGNAMPVLANGTPTHIRYWEITGPRNEGIDGWDAKRDIEANMRGFEPMDANAFWDEQEMETRDDQMDI